MPKKKNRTMPTDFTSVEAKLRPLVARPRTPMRRLLRTSDWQREFTGTRAS
jgi:hypothetical protein